MATKKINNRLLDAFFVLTTILISGHAAQTIIPWINNISYIVGLVSFLLLILIVKDNQMMGTSDTMLFIFFTIMVVCTVITQFFTSISSYVNIFCVIASGYLLTRIYPFSSVLKCFRVVMIVTTIISLIGYTLVQFVGTQQLLPQYTNVNEKEFGFSLIFSYMINTPDRNCAMFWEPGLFATYLALASVFELLFVEKTNWLVMALYVVAFVTANSSAGFVLLFLCVLLLLVRNTRTAEMSLLRSALSLILVVTAIVLIFNFDAILSQTELGENLYFQKLSSDSITDSSRVAAFEHNLNIFGENPFFGAGFAKVAQLYSQTEDTSTSTYLMSVFGLMGAGYTIAWVFSILKIKDINIFSKIILLVMILIILNKEPHHNLLFTWCLLFYSVGGKLQKIGAQDLKETHVVKEIVE